MAGSVSLPFGAGVKLLGKSAQPGRAKFEFDHEQGKPSDRPQRNARRVAVFRRPALLQLAGGAETLRTTANSGRLTIAATAARSRTTWTTRMQHPELTPALHTTPSADRASHADPKLIGGSRLIEVNSRVSDEGERPAVR